MSEINVLALVGSLRKGVDSQIWYHLALLSPAVMRVVSRRVICGLSQIRVPKLEGVWGWCPGCPGRWGVAEIRVLFLWLEMTGCPAALDAPAAD